MLNGLPAALYAASAPCAMPSAVLVAQALDVGCLREDAGDDRLHLGRIPVVGSCATTLMFEFSARLLALLPARATAGCREAAEEGDVARLTCVFITYANALPSLQVSSPTTVR